MADFTAPVSHSQTEGTLGYAAVYAAAEMEMALAEALNLEALGRSGAVGDLAASGSDTLNLTYFDGLGWAEEFVAMSSETEEIVATGYSALNDQVSIGRYGLGKSETFQGAILSRVAGVRLEALMSKTPESLARTIMTVLCTAYQSVSGSAGTTGTAWDFDAELDLIALLTETEGFDGAAVRVGHPEMYTGLYQSLRNEPAFQSAEIMNRLFNLRNQGIDAEPMFGLRNVSSHRVTTSGGDHVGCAYAPGAFALARASTSVLQGKAPGAELVVPALGLYISSKSTGAQGFSEFSASAWFGIGQRAVAVAPAFRCLSIND